MIERAPSRARSAARRFGFRLDHNSNSFRAGVRVLESGARRNLSLHLYNEPGITVFNAAPMREPVWHGKPFPWDSFAARASFPATC